MKNLHIELRSDTFTQPTPGMREAMMQARIGDDVFGEDASTNELEAYCAALLGFEAALFCPSGTMANQIGLHVHLRPGDEVICDALSHVYLYEGGGMAANSMASVQLLNGDRGRIRASQIEIAIQPDNVHHPVSRVVSLENTANKGGGSIYPIEWLREISTLCKTQDLKLHLDGARIWNAWVARPFEMKELGLLFDTASVCLSKGLGAPVGSVLLGSKSTIGLARRVRKRWGGGMRQSGFLAAAGLYALKHQVERLDEDHQRAQTIGQILSGTTWVDEVLPVETNIVIASLSAQSGTAVQWVEKLKAKGIMAAPFGPDKVRFVTHLDFSDHDLEVFENQINGLRL